MMILKNIVDDLFFNKDNIEESIIKLIEYIKNIFK